MQRNITPQLEALCRWECKFVSAYDFIKERFPTRFVLATIKIDAEKTWTFYRVFYQS